MLLVAFIAIVIYSAIVEPSLTKNINKVTKDLQNVSINIADRLRDVSSRLETAVAQNIREVVEHLKSTSEAAASDLEKISSHLEKMSLGIQDHLLFNDKTMEREQKAKEVWVITPDFFWELENLYGRDVVVPNIGSNESNYHYFCKNTNHDKQRVNSLLKLLSDNGWIYVTYVPEEKFNPISCFEYVIFDPGTHEEQGVVVDVLRRRGTNAATCIDLIMEKGTILPHFVELAKDWSRTHGAVRLNKLDQAQQPG